MLGILPFLIQWIALSQLGNNEFFYRTSSPQTKSHWSLLRDFQTLPEEEIDHFLPQVCNMMLDRDSLADDDLFSYFESVMEQKCADCFTFGTRLCGVLKASQQAPSESLFRSILVPSTVSQRSEERLRAFQERAEYATANGYNLPPEISEQRSNYYRDYQFLLDTLARLGTELKGYPVARRNAHLRHALSQCNALLYYRMASRGSISALKVSIQDIFSFPELTAGNIAALCPAAAEYSLHLPLHQCNDQVMRILRFVDSECEVLPSKERCPYLVTAELIPQSFNCKSPLLYAQGAKPAVALERGAAGGVAQVTYGGQARLTGPPANSATNAEELIQPAPDDGRGGYGAEENDSVKGIASRMPEQPVLRSSYRYGVRRRGSLLADSLAQHSSITSGKHSNAFVPPVRRSVLTQQTAALTSGVAQREADELLEDGLEQAYAVLGTANAIAQELGNLEEAAVGDEDEKIPGAGVNSAHVTMFARPASDVLQVTPSSLPPRKGQVDDVDSQEIAVDANERLIMKKDELRGGSTALPRSGEAEPISSRYLGRQHSRSTRRRTAVREQLSSTEARQLQRREEDVHVGEDSLPQRFVNGVYASQEQARHSATAPQYPRGQERSSGGAPLPQHPSQYEDRQLYPQEQQVRQLRSYVRPKTWAERKAIVRSQSPFGHLQGWDMRSFIVKSGDDMRKEVLAMQLMGFCQKVFELEGLDIYLRPYQILSTGAQAGLVEFIADAESIDKIKKTLPKGMGLKQYFELNFGESYSFFYAKAVKNFVKSLVGYSLFTYLVQVKDRHNANILVDAEGHVLHIDFGYILGDSPGFNINFESAPFKLTREYLDVLGGVDSEDFKLFQDLFLRGFLALQKHIEGITSIIQLFFGDKRKGAADGVRSRLLFPQSQADILSLVGESIDNWRTKQYDWYQERTNNIQY